MQLAVGDVIKMGNYNGSSIEWQVLDVYELEKQALLISKECITIRRYHNNSRAVSWATSDIRAWLNSKFLETAFDKNEVVRILESYVETNNNPKYDTIGGCDTVDRIFLLSIDEAAKYFKTAASRRAGWDGSVGEPAAWWLRSPGISSDDAACVYDDGSVSAYGTYVGVTDCAVRPALWLNLDSGIFQSDKGKEDICQTN